MLLLTLGATGGERAREQETERKRERESASHLLAAANSWGNRLWRGRERERERKRERVHPICWLLLTLGATGVERERERKRERERERSHLLAAAKQKGEQVISCVETDYMSAAGSLTTSWEEKKCCLKGIHVFAWSCKLKYGLTEYRKYGVCV